MADKTRSLSIILRGKDRTKKAMRSVSAGLMRLKRMVFSLGSAIVAAAGLGAMGLLIRRSFETIDVVGKMSDRIGMSTASIIGLRHAATITGMTVQEMDKSMQMFVRRLGEVQFGTGEAKRALEKMGLTAEDLSKMSPDQAMGRVADAIKDMPTHAERSAAAYMMFGRAGQKMLNLIMEGSEGIERYREEAERLGMTFSRFDAKQIEEANDALTRMKGGFRGVMQAIAIELAPVIKRIGDLIIDNLDTIRAFFGDVKRFIGGYVRVYATAIDKIINGVVNGIQFIRGFVKDFWHNVGVVIYNIGNMSYNLFANLKTIITEFADLVWQISQIVTKLLAEAFTLLIEEAKIAWAEIKAVFTGDESGVDAMVNLIDEEREKRRIKLVKEILESDIMKPIRNIFDTITENNKPLNFDVEFVDWDRKLLRKLLEGPLEVDVTGGKSAPGAKPAFDLSHIIPIKTIKSELVESQTLTGKGAAGRQFDLQVKMDDIRNRFLEKQTKLLDEINRNLMQRDMPEPDLEGVF